MGRAGVRGGGEGCFRGGVREAVSRPLRGCSVAVARRRSEVSSVRGRTLLEEGLRFCLGTVRLQELNQLEGKEKRKENACQTDFPISYLHMPKAVSAAGL